MPLAAGQNRVGIKGAFETSVKLWTRENVGGHESQDTRATRCISVRPAARNWSAAEDIFPRNERTREDGAPQPREARVALTH